MYCHACEREHDDYYAGCVALETSDTVPAISRMPFLERTLELLSICDKFEEVRRDMLRSSEATTAQFEHLCIPNFQFTPTLPGPPVWHLPSSPMRYQTRRSTTDPEFSEKTQAVMHHYADLLSRPKDFSDVPKCQKTQHEAQ